VPPRCLWSHGGPGHAPSLSRSSRRASELVRGSAAEAPGPGLRAEPATASDSEPGLSLRVSRVGPDHDSPVNFNLASPTRSTGIRVIIPVPPPGQPQRLPGSDSGNRRTAVRPGPAAPGPVQTCRRPVGGPGRSDSEPGPGSGPGSSDSPADTRLGGRAGGGGARAAAVSESTSESARRFTVWPRRPGGHRARHGAVTAGDDRTTP
jgi:hypothetical protein